MGSKALRERGMAEGGLHVEASNGFVVESLKRAMEGAATERSGAAGLAAPQVGWMQRVVLVESTEYGLPLTVMVNPEMKTDGKERILMEEACLSVPGLVGIVDRAARVTVSFFDQDGTARSLVADGWCAGLLQHEIDHLDGILLVDRARPTSLAFVDPYFEHIQPRIASKLAQEGSVRFL